MRIGLGHAHTEAQRAAAFFAAKLAPTAVFVAGRGAGGELLRATTSARAIARAFARCVVLGRTVAILGLAEAIQFALARARAVVAGRGTMVVHQRAGAALGAFARRPAILAARRNATRRASRAQAEPLTLERTPAAVVIRHAAVALGKAKAALSARLRRSAAVVARHAAIDVRCAIGCALALALARHLALAPGVGTRAAAAARGAAAPLTAHERRLARRVRLGGARRSGAATTPLRAAHLELGAARTFWLARHEVREREEPEHEQAATPRAQPRSEPCATLAHCAANTNGTLTWVEPLEAGNFQVSTLRSMQLESPE